MPIWANGRFIAPAGLSPYQEKKYWNSTSKYSHSGNISLISGNRIGENKVSWLLMLAFHASQPSQPAAFESGAPGFAPA